MSDQNNKEIETSLIDELIELKFKKKERTPENISKFMDQLCSEVLDIIKDCDDLKKNEKFEEDDEDSDNFDMRIQRDDLPDDMVPFIVVRKDTTFLDYKCPHCSKENKFSIRKFEKSQFRETECPDCHKEFLVKIEFQPNLKSYVEG